MYRGRVHERVKSSHGIIFAAYHRQQLLALFTLRVLIPDVHPRRYSLTVFFLGNQLVKLSYSKKTTTETLEFHHIAVYGNQVEGIAGVMPPLLLCEPASQI